VISTTRRLGGLGAVLLAGQEDGFGDTQAVVWPLAVADSARVFEVDGPEAWQQLAAAYPRTATATCRHTWAWTGWDGEWLLPRWPAVANDWDGIHLTVAGYLATAGRPLPVGTARTLLAGWNPDETYWLADVLTPSGNAQTWQNPAANPSAGRQGTPRPHRPAIPASELRKDAERTPAGAEHNPSALHKGIRSAACAVTGPPGSTIEGLLSAPWPRRSRGCRDARVTVGCQPNARGTRSDGGFSADHSRGQRATQAIKEPAIPGLMTSCTSSKPHPAQADGPSSDSRRSATRCRSGCAPHVPLRGRHGHRYYVRNIHMTWVELRRFELLTSCMPCLAVPSGSVALSRKIAAQRGWDVRLWPTASRLVWLRSHLVSHWLQAGD